MAFQPGPGPYTKTSSGGVLPRNRFTGGAGQTDPQQTAPTWTANPVANTPPTQNPPPSGFRHTGPAPARWGNPQTLPPGMIGPPGWVGPAASTNPPNLFARMMTQAGALAPGLQGGTTPTVADPRAFRMLLASIMGRQNTQGHLQPGQRQDLTQTLFGAPRPTPEGIAFLRQLMDSMRLGRQGGTNPVVGSVLGG